MIVLIMPVYAENLPALAPTGAARPPSRAQALIILHEYAEACHLLAGRQDIASLYLRGRCEAGQAHYPEAIQFYRAVLARDPDNLPAWLELADVLATTGKTFEAQALYQNYLTRAPQSPLADTIARLSANAYQLKPWSAQLEAGFGLDSDINGGPSSDQVFITGIPISLTLSSQFRPHGSGAYYLAGAGGYRAQLDADWSIFANLSANRTGYFHHNDFDILTVDGAVGPNYHHEDFTTRLLPFVEYTNLGGRSYRTIEGATLHSEDAFDDEWTLAFETSAYHQEYVDTDSQNGWSWSGLPTLSYSFDPTLLGVLGYSIRHDHAHDKTFEDWAHGPEAGLRWAIDPSLLAALDYQFLHAQYAAPQLVFNNITRVDDEHIIQLNLTYDPANLIGSVGTKLRLRYQYLESNSNLPIFDYTRHFALLSVIEEF